MGNEKYLSDSQGDDLDRSPKYLTYMKRHGNGTGKDGTYSEHASSMYNTHLVKHPVGWTNTCFRLCFLPSGILLPHP